MLKSVFLILGVLGALPAFAMQSNYNQADFDKAQSEGKKVVLQLHADWCPVCVKQQKAVKALSMDEKYKDVTFLKADYDQEKELKSRLGVKGQSTLIFFDGQKEVSRAQGITDKAAIEEHIQKIKAM